MAKFNDKISTILNSQLPEFVVADHPKFVEFLKVYYQLLESAELSVTTIQGTDGITLESETNQTNNLVLNSSRKDTARTLLDAGDKILLEDTTYGKFTRGETVTGQITLNSLNVASISNIRGATSTVIELTVTPNSNDVVPVRDQIVELDIANSTINVTADSFVGGSSDAGVGYTTTSSY